MSQEHRTRFTDAIAGQEIDPPAMGFTFIPWNAVAGRSDASVTEASMRRACADASLDFVFVPSWEAGAEARLAAVRESCAAPVWVVPGVLSPSFDEVGVVEGLRSIGRDPDSFDPTLDDALAAALAATGRGIALEASAIAVADDIAGADGPLISPDVIARELLPRYAEITAVVASAGIPAVFHSDGVTCITPADLKATGFQAVHPGGMSDEAFESLLRDSHAAGLAVMGGVSTRDLDGGLPRAVLSGARASVLARGGGLLLADDGGITSFHQYVALLGAFASARGPR